MLYTMRRDKQAVSAGWSNAIPDGGNTGVVFRTLAAVNLAFLLGCAMVATDCTVLVQIFLDHAMLLEWGTLASLAAWCGARALAQRWHWPVAWQWLLGAALPAAVVGVLLQMLAGLDGLLGSSQGQAPAAYKAIWLAAVSGVLLQYYFHLRARAFSPALAEARLQALQARIRPHFLFNSLNAVLSLIREQPRQAEATLEDLADLFRVLMQDQRVLTSLAQEIALSKQYLSIEKIRLGERLQMRWDLGQLSEQTLRTLQVPALLLQPLLENAVHYGVEPALAPATIDIAVSRTLDRVQLLIGNPVHEGDGGGGNAGSHMALENIRERLALLYDVEADLTTAVADGRFEVRLRFPVRHLAPAAAVASVLP
jgi:two-component system sensor histidine kinase AlgZ